MSARTYLSIGDVLSLLREEFPDVTISKIRFLESQGLVDPERSPSGYRKFYERDVERLRWVLRQQREHFLPLKVIRDRLAAAGNGVPPDEPEEGDRGPAPGAFESPWEPGPGELETAPGGAGALATVVERGPAAREAVVEGNGAGVEWPRYETGAAGRPGVSGTDPTPATLRAVPGTGEPGEPASTVRAASGGAARGPATGAHAGSGGTAQFDALASGAGTAGEPTARAPTAGAPTAGVPTAVGATALAHPEVGSTGPVAAPPPEPDPVVGGTGVRAHPPADPHGADRPGAAAPSDEPTGDPGSGSPPATRSSRADRRPGGATPIGPAAALAGPVSGVSLTLQELCAATGLTPGDISALEGFGLIAPMAVAGGVYFDEEALTVAKLVVEFGRYGIEPRHLRLYRNAVEREVGLVEQVVTPLLRQRNPEARQRAIESASELVRLGQSLRSSLVRTSLRRQLGG